MPSPFPGMDPYLENSGAWGDFHSTFINYLRNAINDRLPENYDARIEERVMVIESFDLPPQSFSPDVIVSRQANTLGPPQPPAGPALLEPVTVPLILPQEERQTCIEIYDHQGEELVAVLELLSPTNKLAKGRESYLTKRDEILRQHLHLIEIDLLVGGHRIPTAEALPQDDYYVFVAHRDRRPLCDVYHWSVRQPLPAIPIPLAAPDPDLIVELQPVFAEVYVRGRYERRLRYGAPPRARLSSTDRAWAAQLAVATT